MFYFHPNFSAFVTVFRSKLSSSTYEWDMYPPFAEALNYALEQLPGIEVDGLPEFRTHIVFVPFNKRVLPDRNLPESPFKPDIALMSARSACELYKLDQFDVLKVSQFISEIMGKSPSGLAGWEIILSAVEVEQKRDMSGWALLEAFDHQDRQVSVIRDADQRLDETLDDSEPTTRKINFLSREHMLN